MIVKIKKNHRIMFKKIIIAFIIVIVLLTNETSCTVIKPHFKRGFSIPMSDTASGINYLQNSGNLSRVNCQSKRALDRVNA